MIFDIYGRFKLAIEREHDRWMAYRLGLGCRVLVPDLSIPTEITESELATYLDDLYHELARRGDSIKRVA